MGGFLITEHHVRITLAFHHTSSRSTAFKTCSFPTKCRILLIWKTLTMPRCHLVRQSQLLVAEYYPLYRWHLHLLPPTIEHRPVVHYCHWQHATRHSSSRCQLDLCCIPSAIKKWMRSHYLQVYNLINLCLDVQTHCCAFTFYILRVFIDCLFGVDFFMVWRSN